MLTIDWHRVRILSIACLILLVPVFLILDRAIAPIWESMSEASSDTKLLDRFLALAAEKPAYETALVKGKRDLVRENVLYSNPSPELASAQIQNTVQALVAAAGGQIESSAIAAPQAVHGLQVLTVSLTLTLPPAQLAGLLTAIRAQKPYLIVQTIDLRSTDNGIGTAPLDVQLQINGFSNIR